MYLATSKGIEGFEKRLVIKRILPTLRDDSHFVKLLIEEAKLAVGLSHPNIVQVYDLGCADDLHYIAMEYVDGRDLLRTLATCGRLKVGFPTSIALFIILEVLQGLNYVHRLTQDGQSLKIVHRDVSPSNILLSFRGEVKLSDFGIARSYSGEHADPETGLVHDRPDKLIGKSGYMAPEQVARGPIDHRVDIFAVGILLYELLTGRRLFGGADQATALERILKADVNPAPRHYRPDLDFELECIIMRALAREPDQRFATCNELHAAIRSYVAKSSLTVGREDLGCFMRTLFDVPSEEHPCDEMIAEAEAKARQSARPNSIIGESVTASKATDSSLSDRPPPRERQPSINGSNRGPIPLRNQRGRPGSGNGSVEPLPPSSSLAQVVPSSADELALDEDSDHLLIDSCAPDEPTYVRSDESLLDTMAPAEIAKEVEAAVEALQRNPSSVDVAHDAELSSVDSKPLVQTVWAQPEDLPTLDKPHHLFDPAELEASLPTVGREPKSTPAQPISGHAFPPLLSSDESDDGSDAEATMLGQAPTEYLDDTEDNENTLLNDAEDAMVNLPIVSDRDPEAERRPSLAALALIEPNAVESSQEDDERFRRVSSHQVVVVSCAPEGDGQPLCEAPALEGAAGDVSSDRNSLLKADSTTNALAPAMAMVTHASNISVGAAERGLICSPFDLDDVFAPSDIAESILPRHPGANRNSDLDPDEEGLFEPLEDCDPRSAVALRDLLARGGRIRELNRAAPIPNRTPSAVMEHPQPMPESGAAVIKISNRPGSDVRRTRQIPTSSIRGAEQLIPPVQRWKLATLILLCATLFLLFFVRSAPTILKHACEAAFQDMTPASRITVIEGCASTQEPTVVCR